MLCTGAKRTRAQKRKIKVLSDEQVEELLSGPRHVMVNSVITAQLIDTTPETLEVQRSTKRCPLPYRKLGHKVRFTMGDIQDYLNSSLRPQ
jgi:hypothetical protein